MSAIDLGARTLLMNVNFPDMPAGSGGRHPRICRQGRRDTDDRGGRRHAIPGGREYLWIGDYVNDETSQDPDTDLAAIMDEEAISDHAPTPGLDPRADLSRAWLDGLFA